MKKKLNELNRKIRHSQKKNNGLIHKRNSSRKAIDSLSRVKPTPAPRWIFKELERAFGGAYRSYRVNGRPKMDVETFFSQIRRGLIKLISEELENRNSARIQTTVWIRFVRNEDVIDLAFNSLMTSVYKGSELDQTVDEIIAHTRTQIENPALLNSRFVFDEVLRLDVNFHQLNLTRGSSYIPLPDFIANRKAVINPQNGDSKCFKWAIIAANSWGEIKFNPEQISNLRKFENDNNWSGLKFKVSI